MLPARSRKGLGPGTREGAYAPRPQQKGGLAPEHARARMLPARSRKATWPRNTRGRVCSPPAAERRLGSGSSGILGEYGCGVAAQGKGDAEGEAIPFFFHGLGIYAGMVAEIAAIDLGITMKADVP
jgi:hypothetical protein